MKMRTFIFATTLFYSSLAAASVTFEAYYAVEINGKPVGVSVQRDEVDVRTKARTISYLLKTTPADNDLEQFVRVEQDAKYRPLKYSFHSSVRKSVVKTAGVIKGRTLNLTRTGDTGQTDTKTLALESGTFFSAALGPLLIAKQPTKGQAYAFNAIYEEDGQVGPGEVFILDVETIGSHRVLRTILKYLENEQEAWFLDDGSTIAVQSTSLPVKSYLVADAGPILSDTETPSALLAHYFRNAPAGRENQIARGTFAIPKDGIFKQPANKDVFKDVKRIPLKIVD